MTNPGAEKTARRFRLCRTLCRLSALCFGLAALSIIGASMMGHSFSLYIGQIGMLLSCCVLMLITARACGKTSADQD